MPSAISFILQALLLFALGVLIAWFFSRNNRSDNA
jgi:uncharacterized membrane protein YqjE